MVDYFSLQVSKLVMVEYINTDQKIVIFYAQEVDKMIDRHRQFSILYKKIFRLYVYNSNLNVEYNNND